jgi:hypothetical protein
VGHGVSLSLYDYCGNDPINGIDPDGRFGKNQTASDDYYHMQIGGNRWSFGEFLVRKEFSYLTEIYLSSGYPKPPGGSLVETVLNGSHEYGYPASTTLEGAPNINGDPLWIEVAKVEAEGGSIARNAEIVSAMRANGISEGRIAIYQANQVRGEGEAVIAGRIPAEAINTRSMMVINRLGQTAGVIGVGVSAWNLAQAADQSFKSDSGRPFGAQAVREAGGWGGARVGAKGGALIGTGLLSETGPGALIGTLVGGVAGGFGGYLGANVVANQIEKNGFSTGGIYTMPANYPFSPIYVPPGGY